nr:MAG TPA: hypothetical protein [Bacteriophage sp.]
MNCFGKTTGTGCLFVLFPQNCTQPVCTKILPVTLWLTPSALNANRDGELRCRGRTILCNIVSFPQV